MWSQPRRTRRSARSRQCWSGTASNACRFCAEGNWWGSVSRSNLIQALASSRAPASGAGGEAACKIRHELLDRLGQEDWTDFGERNVIVSGGIVHLWGLVGSPEEHKALLALAEGVPGVASVADEMIPAY